MVTILNVLHSSGLGEHFTYLERKHTIRKKFQKAFEKKNVFGKNEKIHCIFSSSAKLQKLGFQKYA
eukprot:UN19958